MMNTMKSSAEVSALSSVGGNVNPNAGPGPPRPATAQADATRLEERGEREMRAIRLLREASAQILYLIAHRTGSCFRRLVQHQPVTF
jgi:hypothetical protein